MGVPGEWDVPRNGEFYVCGPPEFMSGLTAGITDWGVAASRIHTEIFGSAPAKTPGVEASRLRPPHLPDGALGAGPQVSFARSGLRSRSGSTFQTSPSL